MVIRVGVQNHEGFVKQFGKERVRNTRYVKLLLLVQALVFQSKNEGHGRDAKFADFVTEGFNQIINNFFLSQDPIGGGPVGRCSRAHANGCGHCCRAVSLSSNEAWVFSYAGLKIVYPSNPHDAKRFCFARHSMTQPYLYFEQQVVVSFRERCYS